MGSRFAHSISEEGHQTQFSSKVTRSCLPGSRFLSAAGSAVLALSTSTFGQTIPPAQYSVDAFVPGQYSSSTGALQAGVGDVNRVGIVSLGLSYDDSGGQSGIVHVLATTSPLVLIEGTYTQTYGCFSCGRISGSGHVQYSFSVKQIAQPPAPVTTVPTSVTTNAEASVTQGANGSAVIGVSMYLQDLTVGDGITASPGDHKEYEKTVKFNAIPGQIYTVSIGAQADLSAPAEQPVNDVGILAIIDPIIVIDAQFPFRDYFSVELSPGIEPPPNVLADAYSVNLKIDGLPQPLQVTALNDARAINGTDEKQSQVFTLPAGLGEVRIARTYADGDVRSIPPAHATAAAQSTIVAASLLGGMVEIENLTAASVSTLVNGRPSSSKQGTGIVTLKIAGQPVAIPNDEVPIELPNGLGTLVLFEQLANGDGTNISELETRGLHLVTTTLGGLAVDLILSSAYSGVSAASVPLTPRPTFEASSDPITMLASLAAQPAR